MAEKTEGDTSSWFQALPRPGFFKQESFIGYNKGSQNQEACNRCQSLCKIIYHGICQCMPVFLGCFPGGHVFFSEKSQI